MSQQATQNSSQDDRDPMAEPETRVTERKKKDFTQSNGEDTAGESTPLSIIGEQSVSGDMPDPESDDDTLLNSHDVGLRINEDYDNPQPLNIADDVRKAEMERRGIDVDDDD